MDQSDRLLQCSWGATWASTNTQADNREKAWIVLPKAPGLPDFIPDIIINDSAISNICLDHPVRPGR